MAKKKKIGIPGVSFSWKRALGISQMQAKLSRKIGIPISRAGRQRKVGAALGCLIPTLTILTAITLALIAP